MAGGGGLERNPNPHAGLRSSKLQNKLVPASYPDELHQGAQKSPVSRAFLKAGAGFEPSTFGLSAGGLKLCGHLRRGLHDRVVLGEAV